MCAGATWLFAQSATTRWVVLGAAVLAAWWVYRFGTRTMRRRVVLLAQPFPPQWRAIFQERVAFFGRLSEDEKDRFCRMAQIFLAEKPITPIRCEIDQRVRQAIHLRSLYHVVYLHVLILARQSGHVSVDQHRPVGSVAEVPLLPGTSAFHYVQVCLAI